MKALNLTLMLLGVLVLQILLSKSKSKYPGLILPGITFGYSILAIIAVILFAASFSYNLILGCLEILLTSNIPTLILLAIYFAFHNKSNNNKDELDRMNIKDL